MDGVTEGAEGWLKLLLSSTYFLSLVPGPWAGGFSGSRSPTHLYS